MSPCNQEYMDRCGWRGWDIDRNGSEVDFGNPGLGGGSSSCQPYSTQHYTEYYTSVLLYYTINILCSVSGGAAVSSPNLIVCYISHFYVCIVDPRCVTVWVCLFVCFVLLGMRLSECACVCVCACVFVLSIRGVCGGDLRCGSICQLAARRRHLSISFHTFTPYNLTHKKEDEKSEHLADTNCQFLQRGKKK